MIRTEREYQEATKRLNQEKETLRKQRQELEKENLSAEQIERGMAPLISFYQQHEEEIAWYENIKRQDFRTLSSINQLGQLIIALRIASGLTQKEFARCLNINEAQVSRDERNEYHGISKERISKILEILGVHVKTSVELEEPLNRERILAAAAH